jgi:membrane-associated phospholipid phosphatase
MTRVAPEAAVLFVLAAAIAACRPYLGMHYPSDVLIGAALGWLIGRNVPGLDASEDVWRPTPAPPGTP